MLIGFSGTDGLGKLSTDAPPFAGSIRADAADLNDRIQNAELSAVIPSLAKGTGLSFPYADWYKFKTRWEAHFARVATAWGAFTTTADDQNAFWGEWEAFIPLLEKIGFQNIAPRPNPSSLGDTLSVLTTLAAIGVAGYFAITYLPLLLKAKRGKR